MGYRTPNIDRIANEGMRFTDSYGEQSCTAGRAAFISGQSVYRTGMSKVGVPGADIGWAAEDPTIAELLKPLGYATGQFGKNHFGDMNKHLPTVHGFDEFFGNLYHLNAEEEPEQFDYPHKDQFPLLYELALPRGVLKCKATDEVSNEPDDPKFGPVGKQVIEDTGPLDTKRMETIDDDITDATHRLHQAPARGGQPVLRVDATPPTCTSTPTPSRRAAARPGLWQSDYHDAMIDHDRNVGSVLDCLDELGIAEDTIVVYCTDNGPHRNSWPDGRHHAVPQREGHQLGGRVPGAGDDPLARQDQGGHGVQRDHSASRLAADVPGRRRRPGHHREAEEGPQGRGRRKPSTRSTSTASTCCPT